MLQKPDPGHNYAKLMEEYSSKKDGKLPTHTEVTAERSKESRTVTYVAEPDPIFSFHERFESRALFQDRKAEAAFRLIAIELNFVYEALFTKAVVVHSTRGCIFRAISFIAASIALGFFYKLGKHDYHKFDVGITYTLLFGALGLDSIALFMLISSDLDYRSSEEILAKIFNLIDYSLKEREKMFPNILTTLALPTLKSSIS
ncbi:hypothetical protein ACE6H2_013115 [Prunus campanulata]